jgi:hypothetical protein
LNQVSPEYKTQELNQHQQARCVTARTNLLGSRTYEVWALVIDYIQNVHNKNITESNLGFVLIFKYFHPWLKPCFATGTFNIVPIITWSLAVH